MNNDRVEVLLEQDFNISIDIYYNDELYTLNSDSNSCLTYFKAIDIINDYREKNKWCAIPFGIMYIGPYKKYLLIKYNNDTLKLFIPSVVSFTEEIANELFNKINELYDYYKEYEKDELINEN